jgi:SH3-like domain-containing protein
MRRGSGSCLLAAALLLAGCATRTPPRVDLQAARDALAAARKVHAPERAPDCMKRAEDYLAQAEAAAVKAREAGDAGWLSQLAVSEARCAAQLSTTAVAMQRLPEAEKAAAEAERLQVRARKADDDQRRLEEEVALLSRDLELTENEIIRLKAKLRGLDSKAEASSAIAESRILLKRYQEQRGRSANLARSQELVERAEQQILEENYGAAAFFAQKAQDLLQDRRRSADVGGVPERAAPKKQYTVRAEVVNIRAEPSTSANVVGKAAMGDVLDAVAVRGEWLKVTAGSVSGWVYRRLVD